MNDESNANRELSARFEGIPMPDEALLQGRSADEFSCNEPEASPSNMPKASGAPHFSPADALPFLVALGRRWHWLLIGGVTLATMGFVGSRLLWKDSFTASAQLLRQPPARITEILGERELASDTYASLLRAPELYQRVMAKADPPISEEFLSKKLNITPERNSDVILIAISTDNKQAAVNLANLYATEAVRFTQELQTNAAARLSQFVSQQLAPIEEEIKALGRMPQQRPKQRSMAMRPGQSVLPATAPASPTPSPFMEKLQGARVELADLSARYTDQHPIVREQRAKIAAIEAQLAQLPVMAPTSAPVVASASIPVDTESLDGSEADAEPDPPLTQEYDPVFIHSKLQSLENARLTLLGQKQAALSLESEPPGTCQMLAPATLKEVISHKRVAKVAVLTAFGGVFGMVMAIGFVLVGEVLDTRLKTPADVKRVTGLPVLASAGDLARMTEAEQKNWAFRAWTNLQGALSSSPNTGLVCGITSSEHGEGRSTWVRLLADAASQRGFRVLTIVARPPEQNGHLIANGAAAAKGKPNGKHIAEAAAPANGNGGALVASNVLNTPADVTQKLIGPNPEPVVEIPLPAWVWNLERRKQWQAALHQWSQIDNIALLVELPPASMPETVLLAENLPNLLWLADGQKATAEKTCEQLETLRNARCRLAGAIMNRIPKSRLKNRFARWLGCAGLLMGIHTIANGQEAGVRRAPNTIAAANTNLSFSVVTPAQRAAWQQRLTLGPGDVLTIALWGEPGLTRAEVAVGPDGRISFAEVQSMLASGLTLDELRERMNEELGKYRRAPQTMITPVAFRSKKYFLLGRVMTKGVYTLDRPTTILEAVARAHGFETGLVERNIIDVADFSRSFLIRGGKRVPINFEKLFQAGDLSQNVGVEPGDYIYFPGANIKEVYVVGEVRLPGPTPYTPDLTLMQAISARAGYTDRAYKGHVLIVRGSINNPETFVVETKEVLKGKRPDFQLQPRDIIFVNSRPLIYVEELADLAITAFLQSIVTSTVGQHVIEPFQVEN